MPPYPNHVPFTKGNRRTPWDTGLYKLIVFWLMMMLFLSGEQVDGLPEGTAGVMPQWALVTYCLPDHPDGVPRQDRVPVGTFRAVRADDAVLRAVQQLRRHDRRRQDLHRRDLDGRRLLEAAARLLVDGVDHGSEHAVDGVRSFRKATVKDYPNDIRPSKTTHLLAHIGGTTCEIVMPLVLLFSPWPWLTWIAIISIWMLHTFIISTIPMAVPLEWNVFFMFVVGFLFANFSPGDGLRRRRHEPGAAGDRRGASRSSRSCSVRLRPQYVSFLVGMKQYAGNWASASFSFRDK